MLARDRFRHLTVAAGILVVHAAVVGVLLTVGPRTSLSSPPSRPVEVRFVAMPEMQKQWTPPEVKAVVAAIVAPMPEVPLIEIPVAPPSERAITAPARTTVASPPVSDAGAPRLISSVEYVREPIPRYPPKSRKLREQGMVVLRVLIDEQGTACSIEIETSSGSVRLDHAAREAVQRAAFRPYVEDGLPRRAFVLIPIEFSLSRSSA